MDWIEGNLSDSLTLLQTAEILGRESEGALLMHYNATANDGPAIRIHLCFYREASPTFHVAEHHHAIHQWYVCLHGSFTAHLDGVRYALGAEQSVIVRPHTRRELEMHRRAPGYLVLIFEAPELDLKALENQVLTMPTTLREDMHALIHELQSPGTDSRMLINSLVVRLLIGHKRAQAGTAVTIPANTIPALNDSSQRSLVEAAETYLREHLDQPIQRREIAAALHLSGAHLARVFRAATGRTLVQRLTELRMHKAKELLLESTLSITQVAVAVGMVSFSHFTRTFKRGVGVSPGSYRRTRGLKWE
jgi:AraC-like DNA-binding protein/mannose-6-phosphate isomerase-like protein (cupin superfamily)